MLDEGQSTADPLSLAQGPSHRLPSALTVWTSFLLRQTTLRVQDRVADALRTIGLRPPHIAVLTLLAHGPQSQIALSGQLQTDRTTMVALIDSLEGMDLVVRQRNRADRRAYDVSLTPHGTSVLAEANALVSAADATFFASLSEDEHMQLRTWLLQIINAHDQRNADA